MKILSLAVFGYALYQYLDAKRNLDNTTKSVIQGKIDEANAPMENYKDDLSQMRQRLDSSSMTAYGNPEGITIEPTYYYRLKNEARFVLSFRSTRNTDFTIKDILVTLYAKVKSEYILDAIANDDDDDTYTIHLDPDGPTYGGEKVYKEGKAKIKRNIAYYEATAHKYQNDYYVVLPASNFIERGTSYTLAPYIAKTICVPMDKGRGLYYAGKSDEKLAEFDSEIIESAIEKKLSTKLNDTIFSDIEYFDEDDIIFADIQFNYEQQTNYTSMTYWANTLYKRLPVKFVTYVKE